MNIQHIRAALAAMDDRDLKWIVSEIRDSTDERVTRMHGDDAAHYSDEDRATAVARAQFAEELHNLNYYSEPLPKQTVSGRDWHVSRAFDMLAVAIRSEADTEQQALLENIKTHLHRALEADHPEDSDKAAERLAVANKISPLYAQLYHLSQTEMEHLDEVERERFEFACDEFNALIYALRGTFEAP